MGKLKTSLIMLAKCILAGIIAIAVLSAACYMISFSGTRIHNETGATDFKWENGQWRSTMLEGYSWFRMDENGFNNIHNNSNNPDIILMGSSHMEAANVKQADSTSSILSDELSLDVYNIAMSGHTIYNCVDNMENAVSQYHPNRYLILETFIAELSVEEMQKVIDGELESIVSYDSGALYNLQKYIPALKTIYKQIDFWSSADSTSQPEPSANTSNEENYEKVLYEFLSKAKSSTEECGAKLIIFYHPEIKIDKNGDAYTEITDKNKLELFGETCEKLGIIYVDMTEPFKAMYKRNHLLPYGFSNTAVGAAHLNKYGHQAIAHQLINSIREDN